MTTKLNDIKFDISATNDKELVYGSTVPDSASAETVLAIEDELFSDDTIIKIDALVDSRVIFSEKIAHKHLSQERLDNILNRADEAIEKVIS